MKGENLLLLKGCLQDLMRIKLAVFGTTVWLDKLDLRWLAFSYFMDCIGKSLLDVIKSAFGIIR